MSSSAATVPGAARPLLEGLTSAEVVERRATGRHNTMPDRTSRRYRDIVRANVLTRFNAILAVLAAVVITVGEPIDALFAFVLVFNTGIGVVQEIRAKRTLDRLRVLVTPSVTVVRDGAERSVAPHELVLDDLVRLQAGDQVPVDAVVVDGAGLELDESSLTGESDPVPKRVGDEVLSGSAVVAGGAWVRAVRVGPDARIHQLVAQARQFVLTRSELRTGVERILRVVGWLLVPMASLLLWSPLRASTGVADGLVSAVAGVVGLVPQGLVLLTSLAMAVAIGRLARHHVVVQELFAVEGLARVDVLCVDKTGTLTTGRLTVEAIEALDGYGDDELRDALAALAHAEESPTSTMQVVAALLPSAPPWPVLDRVAFSSARKWSAASFAGQGTWLFGAPEVLLEAAPAVVAAEVRGRVEQATAAARRVLLVAHASEPRDGAGVELPRALRPAGLLVLSEQVRDDAAQTMAYFARQHVTIKVISGDSAMTVSAVARQVGVPGADQAVDLRTVEGPLDEVAERTAVFGRVLPEQKRELVEALQRAGHVVAMTGDGVNDIPALKKADIGIAMDTATAATKAVAQLVLLDGRFDHLPAVVGEGRRVIANIERVSALFVTKTVYATVFALAIGLSGSVFPFLPRHMSLVSELTVGVPAFVLSFRSTDRPCQAGYLSRVIRFAVPAGLVAALVTLTAYWSSRSPVFDLTLEQARTTSTFTLITIALWILYRLVRPLDRFEAVLLAVLAALFAVVLAAAPLRRLYALQLPTLEGAAVIVGFTVASIMALQGALQVVQRRSERATRDRRPTADAGSSRP
ncbi:MAG: HAD-IC family P-type ATPase [Acidimicrobiales bacterium]|nr:HAD-IC family P-type ATPase [Acidimicrobiales bacterium]